MIDETMLSKILDKLRSRLDDGSYYGADIQFPLACFIFGTYNPVRRFVLCRNRCAPSWCKEKLTCPKVAYEEVLK